MDSKLISFSLMEKEVAFGIISWFIILGLCMGVLWILHQTTIF